VFGLDLSEWALTEASRRGAEEGVVVQWHKIHLPADWSLPGIRADAAIVPGWWFGCGADSDQLRTLRTLRRHLVPGALLILETKPFWLRTEILNVSGASKSEKQFHLETEVSVATGRTFGRLISLMSGKTVNEYPFSMRLYSPVEMLALAREAGFAVTRFDSDFTSGLQPALASCPVHLVGRSILAPSASLAVTAWGAKQNGRLDLRYADDEAEWLRPSPNQLWQEVFETPKDRDAFASNYAVGDPFGGERFAPVVSAHFGCAFESGQLTFGAGVTSLLHDLCGLADGGLIAAPELTHGDLEAWALSRGNECRLISAAVDPANIVAAIETMCPALLHLDRPTFDGQVLELEDIEIIAKAASRVGAIVLIDESAAQYLGPRYSAVRLVNQIDDLVVMRGFTKAYSLCGLRVSYAVASRKLAGRVRELVAPLQVSEISFRAVSKVLAAGDIFGDLRLRIRKAKPEFIRKLEAVGLAVICGHETLPWVVVRNTDGEALRIFEERGIIPLDPATSPLHPPKDFGLLRLTVPLSGKRVQLFDELMMTTVVSR